METTWHEGYAAVGGGRLDHHLTSGHGDALGVVYSWCACCTCYERLSLPASSRGAYVDAAPPARSVDASGPAT
jgi:hypothetical protein